MPWQTLQCFRDAAVPKLNNLRRAAAAGLRVPETWWLPAASTSASVNGPPLSLAAGPVILRSGSPTEDQRTTSNAGQLLSLVVRDRGEFTSALERVIRALPRAASGVPQGAVFIQPLVAALEAGVAFFDGFYFERAQARGGNEGLTSGQARGDVLRGHLTPADPWSHWLESIYAVFGGSRGDRRLDLEFARDAAGFVLLQVRPALFPLVRNPTLTLANHKETMGDLPSPWTVSSMVEAGRDISFLINLEPAIRDWEEVYAIEVAERSWLNLSLWFRWLDSLGLPRAFGLANVGGDLDQPQDHHFSAARFLPNLPRVLLQEWWALKRIRDARRNLNRLDRQITGARGLSELYRVTVAAWVVGIHTALAIAGIYASMRKVRQALRLPGAAQLVTQEMMVGYAEVSATRDAEARRAKLGVWLQKHGHRGPLESDFARPRFAELSEVLLAELAAAPIADPSHPLAKPGIWRRLMNKLLRPFYLIDDRREWFRDASMRSWQRLRTRLLEEGTLLVQAGRLDRPEDVFWLRGTDLCESRPLRAVVVEAKDRHQAVRNAELPLTATRDTLLAILARSEQHQIQAAENRVFTGISLGPKAFEGRALKADDLLALLQTPGLLHPDVVLVVPTLEPSWAVVFPRVGGIVADLGGELSHAAILLREASKPAIVNCTGIFRRVKNGDRLRIMGTRGCVEILDGA